MPRQTLREFIFASWHRRLFADKEWIGAASGAERRQVFSEGMPELLANAFRQVWVHQQLVDRVVWGLLKELESRCLV
jgi:hypothetical protein